MIPRRLELPLAVAVGVVVRVPFWVEALRTPVDGDTAIIGLMARHPFRGATMWGQPYGSPVEAWLAAPLLALLQPDAATLRLAYFLLGLGLIPAAYFLARALDERAALPAAVLMACPSPYFLLLAEPGVGDDVEAEGVAIEVRRLPGVADEEAYVIDATQRHVRRTHASTRSRGNEVNHQGIEVSPPLPGRKRPGYTKTGWV